MCLVGDYSSRIIPESIFRLVWNFTGITVTVVSECSVNKISELYKFSVLNIQIP